MTEIRPVHVVDCDAGPRRGRPSRTWGYGEAELRRVMMTAARVDGGTEAKATAALMCSAWLHNGELPEPLDLVAAACRLGSRPLRDLSEMLGRPRAGEPLLLHRRVLASTALGESGRPCTGWGVGYLAALGGVPQKRATLVARRHMLEMSRPVAVVQMALHMRDLDGIEADVRRLIGAAVIRSDRSQRSWL